MKIATKPKDVIKLCHAAIGSAVLLVSDKLEVDDEPFLVCAVPEKGKRAARLGVTQGLYDDERSVFLVSLKTGLMREAPHLSSRVIIFRDAELHLGAETPRGALAELEQEARQFKVGAQAPAVTAERVLENFVTTFVPETGPNDSASKWLSVCWPTATKPAHADRAPPTPLKPLCSSLQEAFFMGAREGRAEGPSESALRAV